MNGALERIYELQKELSEVDSWEKVLKRQGYIQALQDLTQNPEIETILKGEK